MGRIIKSAEEKATNCARFERGVLEEYALSASGEAAGGIPIPAELIAEAVAEAERIREEARDEGHREGFDAGRQQALEEAGVVRDALLSAAEAIQRAHLEFLAAVEPEILRLSTYLAERVLRREIRGDLEVVQETIRAALRNLLEREHTCVHLNPEDLSALLAAGFKFEETFSGFERLEVVPDETVDRGGCAVETKTLHVDARLDSQLQRLFDALTDQG
ncbi:MAG: hypothetical protein IT365_18835 [Candidatus Hydrogenedentes bacterium]|nr:hypothetical protein [Candidatus Hydrogenedentota bacterium]